MLLVGILKIFFKEVIAIKNNTNNHEHVTMEELDELIQCFIEMNEIVKNDFDNITIEKIMGLIQTYDGMSENRHHALIHNISIKLDSCPVCRARFDFFIGSAKTVYMFCPR